MTADIPAQTTPRILFSESFKRIPYQTNSDRESLPVFCSVDLTSGTFSVRQNHERLTVRASSAAHLATSPPSDREGCRVSCRCARQGRSRRHRFGAGPHARRALLVPNFTIVVSAAIVETGPAVLGHQFSPSRYLFDPATRTYPKPNFKTMDALSRKLQHKPNSNRYSSRRRGSLPCPARLSWQPGPQMVHARARRTFAMVSQRHLRRP